MNGLETVQKANRTSLHDGAKSGDYRVTFTHRTLQYERGLNGAPRPVPQFRVSVTEDAGTTNFQWESETASHF